jgi:BirA family biotin operon repressor/biotin-[acetyl-CoA-carboxylase] ligase
MLSFHYDTVDSTNEEAKRLIRAGAIREPAWLLAREQTAGRGSHGRTWSSPRDAGIYLTVVEVPFPAGVAPTSALTLATGVACAEAIEATFGIGVHLKPVNDLHVDGRKLGGILTEAIIQNGAIEVVITGVGINTLRAERNAAAGAGGAVCLADLLPHGRPSAAEIERLVAALVTGVRRWHAALLESGVCHVRSAWERRKLPGSALPTGPVDSAC